MIMINTMYEPAPGTKFITIFKDGSGADIYYRQKDGRYRLADGESQDAWINEDIDPWFGYLARKYALWISLPTEFTLFYPEGDT